MTALADDIDRLLPQTQCTRCGYAGCRPYAEAIAAGDADFNQCPPGGAAVIARLAALLKQEPRPLNPANGAEQTRTLVRIDAARCIGCTLCIQACPVDAIVGAPGYLHAVVEDFCTGCDLCIAPCPVDCIDRVAAEPAQGAWTADNADAARQRFQSRNARLEAERMAEAERLARYARGNGAAGGKPAAVLAAQARARARRRQENTPP